MTIEQAYNYAQSKCFRGGIYLTIEIEGNNTSAVDAIRNFFGSKFDAAEYDTELDYTYCGIDLN